MSRVATPAKTPTPATPQPAQASIPHDKICQRAYEKWVKRGRPHGSDWKDWIEAEAELRSEMNRTTQPARR